ncbi:hypothetical protein JZT04_003506 [Salmonella enterica subsp. enterica serovar Montevideo]|nr:hypothetical protein [Salmonella enterica]EBP3754914.1 hypothetical protein [Salmonella enterica subsp. enterica]ECI3102420.1 hypothetical protein [Salmonella enterica subsp. enterica serovar Montevideo]ECS6028690.1 hypothetical protein [Salmonella enterica subsp. enterica serovar Saintpaul]EDI4137776.1 hypothetical protein [Salmonella enterica subsp. enterica serovar Newport]EDJ3970453.1 hypothetical protein [Salmonella enterica subsp. enterica serovar Muenchen]EDQ7481514.1 hypothetical p
MSLTAREFIGFDPATTDGDVTAMMVVERIHDRWQMGDIWLVEFDAFYDGVCVRDTAAFSTFSEALSFKRGSPVSLAIDPDCTDDELPF